jgi:hypothetical protein
MAMFQGQVMCNPKNPAPKIRARSASVQVEKQSGKYLLDDLFTVMSRHAKRDYVPKETAPKLVE